MRIALRSNVDDVFADIGKHIRDVLSIAVPRALNALETQAEIAGFRTIADKYGIGPRTTEKYASAKLATSADPEVALIVKGKGFPLVVFRPIQTKHGVSVVIKGRRVLFPHTFLARMPSGHLGVFARGAYGGKGATVIRETGRIGRFVLGRGKRVRRANKWGSSELPINELYGSSPADMLSDQDVIDAISERIDEQAAKIIEREIAAMKRGF